MRVKREGCLLGKICGIENFKSAWLKAVRGKSWNTDVIGFAANLDANLEKLRRSVEDGSFTFGRYSYFTITDPKKRTICAASFPERIVHHALMNVLDPVFERYQIYDSYACRKGKGTQTAVLRAFRFARAKPFFLKMDVRKYFDSVGHEVLMELLERILKDPCVLALLFKIIDSYETGPGRGIPIGNLTSQYFANHYLAVFDHHAKERLGCRAYIRYMDDILIFGESRERLNDVYAAANDFIARTLDLEVKPKILDSVIRGAPFLGFLVEPSGIYLSRKSKKRFKKNTGCVEGELLSGMISEQTAADRVTAMAAYTALARARNFRYLVFHGGRPRAITA